MSAVTTVIASILIILVAIALIAVVLLQEGNKQGLGAIGGGAETFFGKNKAKSYEGKLALITKILIVVFIALALIMTVVVSRENAANDQTITMEDLENLTSLVETTAEPDAAADGDVEATAEPVVEATAEPTEAEATAEPAADEAEATTEPEE